MKYIQGTFLTGYVTVVVEGEKPEVFFQVCMNQGITVWNVEKIDTFHCRGNIRLPDISFIQQIKDDMPYNVTVEQKKGLPFIFKQLLRRKEIIVALIASFVLILCLSNIIWDVKVTGVSTEIEEKINKALKRYDIRPGKWTFSVDPPSVIQQNLVNDIPELLWIGVQKKGTTYIFEGVEKVIVEEEKKSGPRHLVAAKNGVIENIYVSKGRPKVHVNDYVEEGDILVSGDLTETDDKDEEKDRDDQKKNIVAAEGKVMARTWYKMNVTIPFKASYELLTGRREKTYDAKLGNIQFPIWGFSKPNYKDMDIEQEEHSLYFFKWKLPFKIVESTFFEKQYNQVKRTKEEAIEDGIKQAKDELKLHLGPKTKFISEKILHQTIDNGKVKLNLFMVVAEDITRTQSISQGD